MFFQFQIVEQLWMFPSEILLPNSHVPKKQRVKRELLMKRSDTNFELSQALLILDPISKYLEIFKPIIFQSPTFMTHSRSITDNVSS